MKNMNRLVVAIVLGASAAASVAIVRVNATRPGNWSSASAPVLVPLNANGATTIAFNSAAAGRRVLTYSAECSVDAPAGNNFAWLDLDVVVNGIVVPPTVGSADAFCSADGVAGFGGYVRSSITVVISVIEGTNRIRIQARGNAGATGVWLGDSALVVHD